MKRIHLLSLVLFSVVALASRASAEIPHSVVLKNWGATMSEDKTSVTIKDPYLESTDEDYPLIFDDETLAAVCKLSGAGKVLDAAGAGSLNLTAGDMASFSADGTILSDAEKHGLAPTDSPDAIIASVTCSKN
jgi:hypothetical protein